MSRQTKISLILATEVNYVHQLTSLLKPWVSLSLTDSQDVMVNQLRLDSRKVESGDTFVAIKGHAVDGRKYIEKALTLGANAVLAQACDEKVHGLVESVGSVPVIYIQDLDTVLSALAVRFYGQSEMGLIGVTGTNGKTTITQLIAQWLDLLGEKSAVMGTTGNGFLSDLQAAANTTGNAIEIADTLASLAQQGAKYTALEVSSHGLVQGRVRDLSFKVGIFTNLSRDHLDYHGTMEEYANAKLSLFRDHQCQQAVLNIDDEVGASWLQILPNNVAVSLNHKSADLAQAPNQTLFATHVDYSETGIDIKFDGSWGKGTLQAPLIGAFNASNLMLALASLLTLGVDKQQLLNTAPKLLPVIGRMELFQTAGKAKVVVDYAHTPDALEKALSALRVHCQGKLWAVIGCGGDRDTGKRPMMADIAERLGDHCILTDDNPRGEDPAIIVKDMLAGMAEPDKAIVEHDRYQACLHALSHADENDIILLAGKGHEDYQVMAESTIHYSDRETAMELLELTK
ncbi:UDP-N-acetylmuramoyl-L-alanyl-D-glutamate--2,6-diaminopimelate ligase [Vibrio tapetis]|uniref:UDP-N-acetylmuramoyl-L-alanyl-D-glutamate--2,6-diaminopimelate ligase n=1 Tax=Vibrio tapetis subsp. tapetis TaxID=1671868 RepID=A0A2N8Z8M9_9VIBR|nr:UDP-N-acetylmuramoyl-L-alanyl-D-glutamate--2,6-diaminopimelate ligase [Vibrio tapetis]SON48213.1 UDP-N-acetylmuramoyl-L-alanyl-D-glutamate:meso-diaminopimelate ligase [Vibrio tapetis subsp. tapetis]